MIRQALKLAAQQTTLKTNLKVGDKVTILNPDFLGENATVTENDKLNLFGQLLIDVKLDEQETETCFYPSELKKI